jgi:hypothetical protein
MNPDAAGDVQEGVGYLLRDAHGKYWHRTPVGTLDKLEKGQYDDQRRAATNFAEELSREHAEYLSASLQPGALWRLFRKGNP